MKLSSIEHVDKLINIIISNDLLDMHLNHIVDYSERSRELDTSLVLKTQAKIKFLCSVIKYASHDTVIKTFEHLGKKAVFLS